MAQYRSHLNKKRKRRPARGVFFPVCLTLLAAAILFGIIFGVRSLSKKGNADDTGVPFDSAPYTDTDAPAATESTGTTVDDPTDAQTEAQTEPEPQLPSFPLGLYLEESRRSFSRISSYESVWPASVSDPKWKKDTWTYPGKTNLICDITYFTLIPSDAASVRLAGWDTTWKSLWDANFPAGSGYRIGYEFDIQKKDGQHLCFPVLSPDDTFFAEEYFELYLYDDLAHANDGWYSHVTQKNVTDKTLYTSIKITLRDRCFEIDRITLTAFVYASDSEFDADRHYTGAEKVSITVAPKRAD